MKEKKIYGKTKQDEIEEIIPPIPPKKQENIISKKLINPVEEYFKEQETNIKAITGRELFNAEADNIDLKTHLSDEEIKLINVMFVNDEFLVKRGLRPVFQMHYAKYMRLKVSKDRLSRQEFVKINSQQTPDELLQSANNIMGISGGIKK